MKINTRTSIRTNLMNRQDATINHEGGLAFKMDAKTRLYSEVASRLMGEPKFYKNINSDGEIDINQDANIINDIQEVAKIDPEFVLQLASYTRNKLNSRTVSVVMLVEAALIPECKKYVRKYTPQIIQRADELAEATAYLQKRIGDIGNKRTKGSMPSALKRGLADAFHNFDEYKLQKYNRKGFVKLKDVLKLVHPKPANKEESELFKRLKEDKLATPETWETVISTKGSTKENWEAIAPKMPIFATLRNLRNLLDHNVNMKPVVDKLVKPEIIKKSKLFPFRFLSAYKELENNSNPYTSKVLDGLEIAMDISVENLPEISGTSFIVADNSGSMDNKISEKSKVTRENIANLMLAISHRICENSITGIFGNDFAIKNFSKRNGILNNAKSITNGEVGCATNAYLTIQYLIQNKIKVDRIILFSDMQCYDASGNENIAEQFEKYQRLINPNVFLYSFDLAGYGTLQVPQDEPKACLIAGWSERVLEYIKLFEEDKKTSVQRIKEWKYESSKLENSDVLQH